MTLTNETTFLDTPAEFIRGLERAKAHLLRMADEREDRDEVIRLTHKARAFNMAIGNTEEAVAKHGDDVDAVYREVLEFTAKELALLETMNETDPRFTGWLDGTKLVLDRVRNSRGR